MIRRNHISPFIETSVKYFEMYICISICRPVNLSTFQEIECENKEDASAKSPWKTEWHNLWIELKSWRSYWQKDEKEDFLENFGPAALYFASSTYDVTSDGLVADSYIGKLIVL